jgi:hypothetical protein
MTQPRTTLQGGYVNQMKANIAQIVAVLEEWAGTTGKPDFRKAEINSLCEPFDQYLDTIARSRQWSTEYVRLWGEFKSVWRNGDGSWTDAKKPAKQLNERFLQVEG